ncbi:hypothetical protein BCR34DRAFT_573221, partial [Clohesyomyces aquaticus]
MHRRSLALLGGAATWDSAIPAVTSKRSSRSRLIFTLRNTLSGLGKRAGPGGGPLGAHLTTTSPLSLSLSLSASWPASCRASSSLSAVPSPLASHRWTTATFSRMLHRARLHAMCKQTPPRVSSMAKPRSSHFLAPLIRPSYASFRRHPQASVSQSS